jgi:thioredoxin-dependent peroxiredoxin
MMKIGEKIGDFCLPNQSNETICLNDFKGKWTVLYFYPKDDTSGCTLEAQDFTEQLKDLKDLNAEVVGVSPDSCDSHLKFKQKYKLEVNLLSDTDKKILERFGVWQKKSNYGREYMGVKRSTFLINPQGEIAYIWDGVNVTGHASEVKEKLKMLQTG